MKDKFVPKLKLSADISETRINPFEKPMRMDRITGPEEIPKFNEVFTDLVKNADNTVKAPDQVMESAMLGNGADIHDVMMAMSKANLTVKITTQMTTKVIQAYEKVISINL